VLIRALHPRFGVWKDMLDRDLNRMRETAQRKGTEITDKEGDYNDKHEEAMADEY
jgi:hypothetical protein